MSRSTARYRQRPGANETDLVERLKEFAATRRRRGYRLAHKELRRAGVLVNHIRDACGVGAGLPAVAARGTERTSAAPQS
jgi:hypothetical protein